MTIRDALIDRGIELMEFYSTLYDLGIGNWLNVDISSIDTKDELVECLGLTESDLSLDYYGG